MGDAKDLEKKTGMDEQRGKMTWPSLVGVEAAQKKSRELWTQAEEALAVFGDLAWFLREFAEALAKEKEVRKQGEQTWGLYYWRSSTTALFRRRCWRGPSRRRSRCFS